MKTMTNVKTRPAAGLDAIETNLSIDWDGMTEEDTRALAQQALIVKWQGQVRKDGIPSGDFEVNAVDYKVGVRAPRKPADVFSLAKTLSAEDRAALLKQLQEG